MSRSICPASEPSMLRLALRRFAIALSSLSRRMSRRCLRIASAVSPAFSRSRDAMNSSLRTPSERFEQSTWIRR